MSTTVSELKAICRIMGLRGYSRMRKTELQKFTKKVLTKKVSTKKVSTKPNADDYLTKQQLDEYYEYKKFFDDAFRKHLEQRRRLIAAGQKTGLKMFDHMAKSKMDFATPAKRAAYERASHAYMKQERMKRQAVVEFTLKAGLSEIDGNAVNKKQLKKFVEQLSDKKSKAWSLVRYSYNLIGDILKEEYLGGDLVKVTLRMYEDDPIDYLVGNYGDVAGDTWMEGDIMFDSTHEVDLVLVGQPHIK